MGAIVGVREVRRIRSHAGGSGPRVDLVVAVDPSMTTADSHAIADEVEGVVRENFSVWDVTVHVEPD